MSSIKRTVVLDLETVSSANLETLLAIEELASKAGKDPESYAALCPALARVVCVGMRDVESGRERAYFDAKISATEGATSPFSSDATPCGGEKALLEAVNDKLGQGLMKLITFNGRSFDLPVLIHRMVAHQIKPSDFLLSCARQPRYKGVGAHIDLREQATFQGAVSGSLPLRALAIGYGLEDPKANGAGSEVADLVRKGDAAALVKYCLGDVRVTAQLFERWRDCVGVA